MQISYTTTTVSQVEADVLVVPLYDDDTTTRVPLRELDKALDGGVADAIERGELRGNAFETSAWPSAGIAARVLLFVGAGARADADEDMMRRVYAAAGRVVGDRFAHVGLVLRSDAHAQAAVEGVLWGAYEPDLHKSERRPNKLESIAVAGTSKDRKRQAAARKGVETGGVVADAVNFARTLVAEPPNELTPTRLAERAQAELKDRGVAVEVLKGAKLQRFGGLLGVAKGSDEPPVFITMSWTPSRARKSVTLGLVGKGVTFDSGGLSLKPSTAMEGMKGDMAGGAAVIAAMRAIADLNVPINVRAVVPATENMPSGKATRVGDVIKLYSGKTAEILNTDAEGRIILHDALAWLAEQGVTHMVDAATLTGAIVIALGDVAIGVMGRPDNWVNSVVSSARKAGERAWPLPLYREYREQISSDIADMKNIGGRNAGSITAAWFLAEAVPADLPWAHLDIAGAAWGERKPYRAPGATGAGVAAFVRLAQDMAGK